MDLPGYENPFGIPIIRGFEILRVGLLRVGFLRVRTSTVEARLSEAKTPTIHNAGWANQHHLMMRAAGNF